MAAAQLNFMKAVVGRCDQLIPHYAVDFEEAYAGARQNLYGPAGLTDTVLAEVSAIPELDTSCLVSKFDRADEEQNRATCRWHLNDLRTSATVRREPR